MALYKFKAADQNSVIFSEKIEAETESDVHNHIKARNLIPIEIKKVGILDFGSIVRSPSTTARSKECAVVAQQISFLIDAGMPITKCMELVMKKTRNKKLIKSFAFINSSILKGDSFFTALDASGAFPKFFVHMTQVGEQSGKLSYTMQKLNTYYLKEQKQKDALAAAMLYPSIVTVLMLCVITVALLFVVPNYSRMFEASGQALPLITQILIDVSNFFVNNSSYLLLFVILILLSVSLFLKTDRMKKTICYLKLQNPIYLKTTNLRFAQSTSLLLDSGLDVVASLEIAKQVLENSVLGLEIDNSISKIKSGSSLSQALKTVRYFDESLLSFIELGEETGRLAETIAKSAEFFESETEELITRVNKLIEPMITLILGTVLALVMLAIMLPTFYMANNF